jgi:hypothetical protein
MDWTSLLILRRLFIFRLASPLFISFRVASYASCKVYRVRFLSGCLQIYNRTWLFSCAQKCRTKPNLCRTDLIISCRSIFLSLACMHMHCCICLLSLPSAAARADFPGRLDVSFQWPLHEMTCIALYSLGYRQTCRVRRPWANGQWLNMSRSRD